RSEPVDGALPLATLFWEGVDSPTGSAPPRQSRTPPSWLHEARIEPSGENARPLTCAPDTSRPGHTSPVCGSTRWIVPDRPAAARELPSGAKTRAFSSPAATGTPPRHTPEAAS